MEHSIHADIRWRFAEAVCLAIAGMGWIVGFLWVGPSRFPGVWGYVPAGVGLVVLWLSRRTYRTARARWYGLSVESRATAKAIRVLSRRGWNVRNNVTFPRGDVDLVVDCGSGAVPVEIKAFHRWDATEARCAKALAQVAAQCAWLGSSQGVIWLPHARVGWWRSWRGKREEQVVVVFGNAKRLRGILRRTAR